MKKMLGVFLGLVMVFALAAHIPAFADESGDYEYEIGWGENECRITKYRGQGGDVVIPSTLGGYPVVYIDIEAFCNCSMLTSVTIPDSVTEIGNSAFGGCTGLTSITIPDSVRKFDAWVFEGCTRLTSITIGAGLEEINRFDFDGCASLMNINVDSRNTEYCSIGGVLFDKTKSYLLQYPAGRDGRYDIPASVTAIGMGAFYDCTGLTDVTIPNSVTSIGPSAFEGCTSLPSVTIPNSVTRIYEYAFKGCTGLESITIGSGVRIIGQEAFYGCTSLMNIDVDSRNISYCSIRGVLIENSPSSSKHSLIQCPARTKEKVFVIPSSVTDIGAYAFEGCTSLTSVTIPASVTQISYKAFYGCTGLTDVMIPNSVTDIGAYAFYGCSSLKSVTIGIGVTLIKEHTFNNCTSLTDVYYSGTEEQWEFVRIHHENQSLIGANFIYNWRPLILPAGLTTIGSEAFANLPGVNTACIPASVTDIADDSFDPDITIKAPAGSYAIAWAKDHNFSNFSYIED